MYNELFNLLDHWKSFPNYQLERRADIFFAVHLSQILKETKGVIVELIIPEFPVHIETILPHKHTNKSYKIDFIVKLKDMHKVLLIELKTDSSSRRKPQDDYLLASQKVGFKSLLDGLVKINSATKQKYKKKYFSLLSVLSKANILHFKNGNFSIPNTVYTSEIIYIQPKSKVSNSEIGFNQIIAALNKEKNPLTQRFCESLTKWENE